MKKIPRVLKFGLVFGLFFTFCFCGPSYQETEEYLPSLNQVNKVFESPEHDSLDAYIENLMDSLRVPGVSIAFIQDGNISESRQYGVIQRGSNAPVNHETMFSVGSISKVVNAFVILMLVDQGKIDLDADVNQYLVGWKIDYGEYSGPVTIRQILSHTAGLSVHGFDDFMPGEELPTTTQILNGESPAKNDPVKLIFPVGSKFKYSGGGITVLQKVVEDVTQQTYHEVAKRMLFDPLGLNRTSFENPLPVIFGNIAKAHNAEGVPVALPRGYEAMPEKAASGLWTTPSDLAKLVCTLFEAQNLHGEHLLLPNTVKDMISPEKNSAFGLGPELKEVADDLMIFHDGANNSYRGMFAIYWEARSGYVIFTNGTNGWTLKNTASEVLQRMVVKD